MIAHPPCTYLTVSGNSWYDETKYHSNAIGRYMDRVNAIDFFMRFVFCNAKRLAIENPVGIMSSVYRKPNQIIQPYMFGHPNRKQTCLWLRNLPPLEPTNIVEPNLTLGNDGKYYDTETAYAPKSENGKYLRFNDPETARLRSRTFEGIGRAMAEQWGRLDD